MRRTERCLQTVGKGGKQRNKIKIKIKKTCLANPIHKLRKEIGRSEADLRLSRHHQGENGGPGGVVWPCCLSSSRL